MAVLEPDCPAGPPSRADPRAARQYVLIFLAAVIARVGSMQALLRTKADRMAAMLLSIRSGVFIPGSPEAEQAAALLGVSMPAITQTLSKAGSPRSVRSTFKPTTTSSLGRQSAGAKRRSMA